MIKKLDLNHLMAALHELDGKLDGKEIIVRAVGGFALAWHNVRADGLTSIHGGKAERKEATCQQRT